MSDLKRCNLAKVLLQLGEALAKALAGLYAGFSLGEGEKHDFLSHELTIVNILRF